LRTHSIQAKIRWALAACSPAVKHRAALFESSVAARSRCRQDLVVVRGGVTENNFKATPPFGQFQLPQQLHRAEQAAGAIKPSAQRGHFSLSCPQRAAGLHLPTALMVYYLRRIAFEQG